MAGIAQAAYCVYDTSAAAGALLFPKGNSRNACAMVKASLGLVIDESAAHLVNKRISVIFACFYSSAG